MADLSRDRVEQIIREAIEEAAGVGAISPAVRAVKSVRRRLGVTLNVIRFENGLRDQLEEHAHLGPNAAIRAAATWAVEQLQ